MGPFTVGEIPSLAQSWNVFYDDGTPWDLSAYTLITPIITMPDGTIRNDFGSGSIFQVPPATSGVNNLKVTWGSPSIFTQAGSYQIQFMLAKGSSVDYSKIISFEVEPVAGIEPTVLWATKNEALQITGRSMTQENLMQAQGIIDIVTNRTTKSIARIRPRDLVWLKRALAYQAAWMIDKPDIFTKTLFNTISQDGFTATPTYKSGAYLGPMAERALKNCSWLRTRSLLMRTPFVDGNNYAGMNPHDDDSLILSWDSI
jgi:hypothetical protein